MNNYTGTNDNDAKEFIETEVIPFASDEIYNSVQSDKKFNQYFKDKNNAK